MNAATFILEFTPFFLEIMFGIAILSMPCRKRKGYFLRFPFCLIVSYAIFAVYLFFAKDGLVSHRYIYYIVVLFSVLTMLFCLEERVSHILFNAIFSLFVQHFYSMISSILFSVLEVDVYENTVALHWALVIQLVVDLATWAVIYAFFLRKGLLLYSGESKDVVVLFATAVFVMLFFNMWRENSSADAKTLNLIAELLDTFCCVFVCWLLFYILYKNRTQKEREQIERLWEMDRTRLEQKKENTEALNLKFHDLKYRLAALQQEGLSDEAFQDLRVLIDHYASDFKTGNETLDIALSEYGTIAGKKGIRIKCIADGKQLDFLDTVDLYSLVGNALSNAVEYLDTAALADKTIDFSVKRNGNFVSVHVENPFEGKLQFVNGLPKTTKTKEPGFHGYGMKSMSRIVEKYNGTMAVATRDASFVVNMIFPREPS